MKKKTNEVINSNPSNDDFTILMKLIDAHCAMVDSHCALVNAHCDAIQAKMEKAKPQVQAAPKVINQPSAFKRRSSKELFDQLQSETNALFKDETLFDPSIDWTADAIRRQMNYIPPRPATPANRKAKGKIIEVEGKQFEVLPNPHYITLINSTN